MKASALLLLLATVTLLGSEARGQPFQLTSTVFGSAGGAQTGSPLRLGMTLGQSVTGSGTGSSGPAYAEGAGFWHWVRPTPAEQIAATSDAVQALVTGGVLLPAQGNSLQTKLGAASDLLTRGNTNGAISKLGDFVKQVSSLIKTGKITSAAGQPLIDAAQALIAELQGPGPLAAQSVAASGASFVSEFALYPNAPNPFDGHTVFRFAIPTSAGSVPVKLGIYDVSGRQVRQLVAEARSAGVYTVVWDGGDGAGHRLGVGIYFCRLTAGSFEATRRLALTR